MANIPTEFAKFIPIVSKILGIITDFAILLNQYPIFLENFKKGTFVSIVGKKGYAELARLNQSLRQIFSFLTLLGIKSDPATFNKKFINSQTFANNYQNIRSRLLDAVGLINGAGVKGFTISQGDITNALKIIDDVYARYIAPFITKK
jgi:hypothetical protein